MTSARKRLELIGENQIGLAPLAPHGDGLLHSWLAGVLATLSLTAGVALLSLESPLGVPGQVIAFGLMGGGTVIVIQITSAALRAIFDFRDERTHINHVHHLAALERRRRGIEVSTVTLPARHPTITVHQASGATVEMEVEREPTLIDPAAAEIKAAAIAWLAASERARPTTDRADKVVRWDKMGTGWSPEAWTRARDSLTPLVESNPSGMPKGTYCVAADFPTVDSLRAGIEDGRIVPSPSGAVVLRVPST